MMKSTIRRSLAFAGLLAVTASMGCSAIGNGKSNRKTPLPPSVEPSAIANSNPAVSVAAMDARPYYAKEKAEVEGAAKESVADAKTQQNRQKQAAVGDKVPTAESAIVNARKAETKKVEVTQKQAQLAKQYEQKVTALESQKQLGDLARALGPTFEVLNPALTEGVRNNATLPNDYSLASDKAKLKAEKDAEEAILNAKPGVKNDILILSGGVAHGAFQAGVLCGWSEMGTRPNFQVVTGVSTGALVAAAVFAGPEYDSALREFYTTLKQKPLNGDIWRVKRLPPLGIGTESLATNAPLRKVLRGVLDSPGYFEKIASEHASGRRLYIGTTNLDTERFVIWDLGAIASEGTPESRKLYEDLLLASAAMPPLLSPAHIKVKIDGKEYDEMHVDGGTTRNLFFYPPSDWPGNEEDEKTKYRMLAGARVYVVLAGRVYADPEGTNSKVFSVGFRAIGTLLNSLQRAELARISTHCALRDMDFKLAAIPSDFLPLFPPSEFDPAKMTELFCEGYKRVQEGRLWNEESPDRAVSEERARRGTELSSTPSNEIGPLAPPRRSGGIGTRIR